MKVIRMQNHSHLCPIQAFAWQVLIVLIVMFSEQITRFTLRVRRLKRKVGSFWSYNNQLQMTCPVN